MSKSQQIEVPEDLTIGDIERTPDGVLTHKGMRQVLARGGSVVHQGQHIGNVNQLPDQIVIDGNSEQALDSLEEDLDKQEADLQAKRSKIARKRKRLKGKSGVEPGEEAEVEETEDLNNLSKAELRERAEAAGIEVTDDMKKADIIEAIEGANG